MLQRHDLLVVDKQAWHVVRHGDDLDERASSRRLVENWAGEGWPVIVRRRAPADDARAVPVALSLPPTIAKRRLAFTLPPDGVTARSPILLQDATSSAPDAWRATILSLVRLGEDCLTPIHVFGSLMWQHVTRLRYVGRSSDLDLLWHVPGRAAAVRLVGELERQQRASCVRLDGEIVLPNGAGVQWRELSRCMNTPGATVLVKTMNRVETVLLADLFACDHEPLGS